MIISKVQITFLILIVICSFHIAGSAQTATVVAKSTFPSVVMIQLQDAGGKPTRLGSGFFVRPDVIATNLHVINGGASAIIKQVGNPKVYQIEGIVGIDELNDLALLKVQGISGRALQLADISQVEIGQDIFVLGNPQGLEGTISTGILSSTGLRQIGKENLLQITAPISAGSSGGPVVNSRGEVVGVTVSSLKSGQNLNFAIPASFLANLMAKSGSVLSFADTFGGRENAGSSEPSSEVTSTWLSRGLLGRSYRFSNLKITIRSLSFNGCSMTFAEDIQPLKGESWRNQYTVSLKDFVEIFEATPTADYVGDFVQLRFRPESVLRYRTLDDSYARYDNLKFPTGDSKLSEQVVTAFERLSKSCGKD